VRLGADRFVIEMAPVWGNKEPDRGVVGEGAVGLSRLGRSRFFRYEVRRWRNGVIPDVSEAVASSRRLSTNRAKAQKMLELVPAFRTVTWGRDELRTGDMWNSNSLTSWLLARSGHDVDGGSSRERPGTRMGCRTGRRSPGGEHGAHSHGADESQLTASRVR
jgi:hypothetical protein